MNNQVDEGLKFWNLSQLHVTIKNNFTPNDTQVTIPICLLHYLTDILSNEFWLKWRWGASWSSPYAEVIKAEAGQFAALSWRRLRQRLRLGAIYSGWHSSLIVSNGMSWPQHDKAKCGSERGQDSYLVPMLSYLPCAILDILRDLCTQHCMHPLLPLRPGLCEKPGRWEN